MVIPQGGSRERELLRMSFPLQWNMNGWSATKVLASSFPGGISKLTAAAFVPVSHQFSKSCLDYVPEGKISFLKHLFQLHGLASISAVKGVTFLINEAFCMELRPTS